MKLRNTLILLLIAGGIFGYIWFVERNRPTTREALERSRRVVEFDRDRINVISIKNPDAKIELRKNENGVWQLEEPVKDRADSMAITQLLTTVETLRHDAVLGEEGNALNKDQMKEFGVSTSDTKVKFSGGDKTLELLVGKDAAVEGKIYLRVDGSNSVFVVPNDLKNQLSKKADDFRDRKLTDLTPAQVSRVVIQSVAGEIEAEKKSGHWFLLKPLKARGDDSKIGDLIAQATTARVHSFIAEPASTTAYGLQEPRGSVTLFSDAEAEPVVLQIGTDPQEEKEKDKVYAKLSSRESVVLIPNTVLKILETKPNELRDKHLLRVESDIVDRITIEPAGADAIVLARSGENWVRKTDKDVPANSAAAARLLNDLQTHEVTEFVTDVASDVAKYGLDKPRIKVTLSSFASENTAETKAGEKAIVSVLFGNIGGENVFAKVEEEPFIVSVSRVLLDSIPSDPIQWQELAIYKFKPGDFKSLDVTKQGGPTVSVQRDKESWNLVSGDGIVNQINVESLVNTLANLRAVRWIGATTQEHGLDQPILTITFNVGEGKSGKLSLGAQTADEMSFATAEGLSGTFAVSRPDAEALRLAIIDTVSRTDTSNDKAEKSVTPTAGGASNSDSGRSPTTAEPGGAARR